jgi:NAD(P)-binding Rossmann-like domain
MKISIAVLAPIIGMARGGLAAASVKKDVCIVGGGPSGIYSAFLLEEKGYSVTVFEKESRVGGLTVPYFNEDGTPILRHILSVDMDIVLDLQAQFGMYSEFTNLVFAPYGYGYFHNCRDQCFPFNFIDQPPPTPELIDAAIRYMGIVGAMDDFLAKPGHVGTAQARPDLLVPIGQWLAANDLLALAPIFYQYVTAYGNGFLDYTPAVYILKIIRAATMQEILATGGLSMMAPHEIVEKMAATLNDVRLNSEIISLTGSSSNKVLRTSNPKVPVYICDKVILAFGDSTKALEFVKNLKKETQDVLERLDVLYYHETITKDDKFEGTPDWFSFAALVPLNGEKVDNVPGVHVRWPVTAGSSYTLSLLNSGLNNMSEEDIVDATVFNLNQLLPVFGENALSSPLTAADIVEVKRHEYKPHVNSAEFQAGFYDDLDALQGDEGIYFVGSILDFEIVNAALRSAKDVVEKYFPARN